MYTFHFYSGTHDTAPGEDGTYWMGSKIDDALDNGLALFCTEWGISEATGDGGPYINYAERWMQYLEANKISWCNWSLAKKNEISAAFLSTTSENPVDTNEDGICDWPVNELSTSGNYVRAKIKGDPVPMYSSSSMAEDFENGIDSASINEDSPNQSIAFAEATIGDSKVLKVSGISNGGVWDNRFALLDLGTTYGIYSHLTLDVYLPNTIDVTDPDYTVFQIQPVIQSEATGWWGANIPEASVVVSDLTAVGDYYKATMSFSLDPLGAGATDHLGHILLLTSLTSASSSSDIYFDNFAFASNHNGDVSTLPVIPDEPGWFVKLPFDFESGQREGWKKDGDSAVDYKDITISMAETKALCFPVSFDTTNNEWEDGARLTSSHFEGNVRETLDSDVVAIALDVYLEKDCATQGEIDINVCPIPNGDGYWYHAGIIAIDPVNGGEEVPGTDLIKYSVGVNLSENGEYPFSEDVKIRNLILALASDGSDYVGNVYYDNIRFIFNDEASDETALAGIELNDEAISTFDSDVYEYTVYLDANTPLDAALNVKAIKGFYGERVSIEGTQLVNGEATTVITVTSQDASQTKTYTIHVFVNIGEARVRSFVENFYTLGLNRTADEAGLADWTTKISNRKITGADFAYGIIFSTEFQNRNYSNEEYVNILYSLLLNRSSDAMGMNTWKTGLDNGTLDREDVFGGLVNSTEYFNLCNESGIGTGLYIKGVPFDRMAAVNTFVMRMYLTCLNRDVDKDGSERWIDSLIAGNNSGGDLIRGFFNSEEYLNQNNPDSIFVNQLYITCLGREGDEEGMETWISALENGMPRSEVINGFINSEEFGNICTQIGIQR